MMLVNTFTDLPILPLPLSLFQNFLNDDLDGAADIARVIETGCRG